MIGRITGKRIDYSKMTHSPNIDTMCTVLATTQKEMGLVPEMVEAEYDRMGTKIRRFKRNSDGTITDSRTGNQIDFSKERDFPVVDRINDSDKTKSNVRVLKKSNNGNEMSNTKKEPSVKQDKQGIVDIGFCAWYNRKFDGYDDDDDDDEYICEYCTNLGYSNKYKAYICDNCTKCETCSEFQNEKCDGCTYSRTRTGRLYSESLTIEQLVDPDDLELLKNSEYEDHVDRRGMGNFSMLDY